MDNEPSASSSPAGTRRLFLALPLSEPMRRQLGGFQAELRRLGGGGKFVPFEQLHLTVLFLGDADEAACAALRTALAQSPALPAALPLDLELVQVAAFHSRPRLLFAEFDDPQGRFARLAELCRKLAAQAGFRLEPERPARPHATLVRFRTPGDFLPCLRQLRIQGQRWIWDSPRLIPVHRHERLAELRLYQSVLRAEGPRHECLERFPPPPPV